MTKTKTRRIHRKKSAANTTFLKACQLWERGHLKDALKLFLVAAKAGDSGAQLNVGYFYDTGEGIPRNRKLAFHWYRRAFRNGAASAANNIGTIYRDEQKYARSLAWFRRAAKLGDVDSNLEIAQHFIQFEKNSTRAIPFLNRILRSSAVTENTLEVAKRLRKTALRSQKSSR